MAQKLTRLAAVATFTLKLQFPPLPSQTAASALASGRRPPGGQMKERRKKFLKAEAKFKLAEGIRLGTGSDIQNNEIPVQRSRINARKFPTNALHYSLGTLNRSVKIYLCV